MTKPKTYALYVNLSASQTRKRLKGYGFGVKDVQAADRNQAVILHTATGEHLQDLKSLFADVISSTCKAELDVPLENLRNLGSASAAWLREIGVQTRADLERVGPVATYRFVNQNHPGVGIHLLWALAAALTDRDLSQLSDEEKSSLRAAAEATSSD